MASVALAGVPELLRRAEAQVTVAADFGFESLPASLSTKVATYYAGTADSGINSAAASAYGFHIGSSGASPPSSTTYSDPSGNGSAKSFSSTHWVAGDYYQFNVSTVGLANVIISFDQDSSGTGPTSFSLAYSIDGTTFATYTTYAVVNTSSFATGTSNTVYNNTFDLSSVTALANDASAIFRLVDNTTPATTGTDRVDNVIVETPEPASVALSAFGASLALLRRRRRA